MATKYAMLALKGVLIMVGNNVFMSFCAHAQ
jgi:hypothetical protein